MYFKNLIGAYYIQNMTKHPYKLNFWLFVVSEEHICHQITALFASLSNLVYTTEKKERTGFPSARNYCPCVNCFVRKIRFDN